MSRDSLAAAHAELFDVLSAGSDRSTIDGVTSAYDHDPGQGRALGPIALTVETAGIGPDDYHFAIRLYADIGTDPKTVQRKLDAIMPAITALVSHRWGPENWVGPNRHPDRDDVMVCEWVVSCGREDED